MGPIKLLSVFQYLAEIGYCPQFDAIIEDLTGEEMLQLYAALRGTSVDNIDAEVETWVHFMGNNSILNFIFFFTFIY